MMQQTHATNLMTLLRIIYTVDYRNVFATGGDSTISENLTLKYDLFESHYRTALT
jgi:hypothetical protein